MPNGELPALGNRTGVAQTLPIKLMVCGHRCHLCVSLPCRGHFCVGPSGRLAEGLPLSTAPAGNLRRPGPAVIPPIGFVPAQPALLVSLPLPPPPPQDLLENKNIRIRHN
jgi:hypothetical protein